eukprot:scaffold246895_cov30-Tisochrysis_lutea.AAC.1
MPTHDHPERFRRQTLRPGWGCRQSDECSVLLRCAIAESPGCLGLETADVHGVQPYRGVGVRKEPRKEELHCCYIGGIVLKWSPNAHRKQLPAA